MTVQKLSLKEVVGVTFATWNVCNVMTGVLVESAQALTHAFAFFIVGLIIIKCKKF